MKLDFEIVYGAGIKHQAANTLSSLPTNGSHGTALEKEISVMVFTLSNKRALNFPIIAAADALASK